jgi:hypothetical protein
MEQEKLGIKRGKSSGGKRSRSVPPIAGPSRIIKSGDELTEKSGDELNFISISRTVKNWGTTLKNKKKKKNYFKK